MLGLSLAPTGRAIIGGGAPSLDFDFTNMTAATVDPRLTVSRATMGWRVDSAGVYSTAAHNQAQQSQDMTAAAWTKSNCSATGGQTAPDGTATATLITGTASTVACTQNITVPSGVRLAVSVHVKVGASGSFMRLRVAGGAEVASQWFNTSTGAVGGTSSSASIQITNPTATDAGNGWWRVSAIFTSAGFTTLSVGAGPSTANSGGGVSGDQVLLWGYQAEQNRSVRAYLPTTTATVHSPRFDYDPVSLAARGLLLEEQRTNNVTNIGNMAVSPWGSANIFTRTPFAGLAPDGTYSATLLEDNSSTVTQYTDVNVTVPNDSTYWTWSCYVKAGSSDVCHLRAYIINGTPNLGTGVGVNFTFSTKTLGAPSGTGGQGTATAADAGAQEVGGGWFRIWVRIMNNSSGNTSLTCRLFPANAGNSVASTGTIYAWGAQAENTSFPTTLIPTVPTWTARTTTGTYFNSAGVLTTAASGVARYTHRYNGSAWVPAGLLIEGAATNLIPGQFTGGTYYTALNVTIAAGATSPDGTANAATFTQSAAGTTNYGASLASGSMPTITAGTAVTGSVFVKAGTGSWLRVIVCDNATPTIGGQIWVNTSTGAVGTVSSQAGSPTGIAGAVQNVGNGWFRVSLTVTLGSATTASMLFRMVSADQAITDAGGKTMSFYGPQLEAGATVATSYIPTTTASASRVADSATLATVTRAGDFATVPVGTWFNASAGTMLAEFDYPDLFGTINASVWQIDDGTANNRIFIYGTSNTNTNLQINNANVTQATISRTGWLTAGTAVKVAAAWATNDAQAAFGGSLGTADSSVTLPTGLTTLRLGATSAGPQGKLRIRRLRFYGTRLPNSLLQSTST